MQKTQLFTSSLRVIFHGGLKWIRLNPFLFAALFMQTHNLMLRNTRNVLCQMNDPAHQIMCNTY